MATGKQQRKRRLSDNGKITRSVYLRRLFLSYILLLIPTFLAFSFFTSNIFQRQRAILAEGKQAEIVLIQSGLESEFQGLMLQGLNISMKQELSKTRVYQNGTDARKSIGYMKDFRDSNVLIADAFLWYGDEYVYSAAGMSRFTVFTEWQLHLSGTEQQRMLDWISGRNAKQVCLIRAGDMKGYLLYHVPITADNGMASINYLISLQPLTERFSLLADGCECVFSIALENGGAIRWQNMGDLKIYAQADDMPALSGNWLHLKSTEPVLGMRIFADLNTSQLYSQVRRDRTVLMLLLAAVLLAAISAALALSQHHSHPIRQIARDATNTLAAQDAVTGREWVDEISAIRRMIQITSRENRVMQGQIQDTRRQLLQQTLLLMLRGVTVDEHMLHEVLGMNDLELHEKCFAVALLIPEGRAEKQKEQCAALLKAAFSELCCEVNTSAGDAVAVVLQISSPGRLRISCQSVVQRLSQTIGQVPFRVCVSRCCEAMEQINLAYLEAVFIWKSFSKSGHSIMVFFEDIVRMPFPSMHFDPEDVQEFHRAMESMNYRRVEKVTRVLLRQIQAHEESPDIQMLMRSHLMQLALYNLIPQQVYQDRCAEICMLDVAQGEDFAGRLLAVLRSVCSSSQEEERLFAQAVEYIEAHYQEQSLSLEEVAQYICQPRTYVSRIFRSQCGMRYIDYLSDVRMKKAAELLQNTSLQIREITQRVGYWDSVSFQKKFKGVYGMNPSEYRRNNKQKTEDRHDGTDH